MSSQKKIIKPEINEIKEISPEEVIQPVINSDEKDPHAFDNGTPFNFNNESIIKRIDIKGGSHNFSDKSDVPLNPFDYSDPEYLAKVKSERDEKIKKEQSKGGFLKRGDIDPPIKPIKTY